MPGSRPALRCFPRADRAFQRDAERLFDEWATAAAGQPLAADEFEKLLRARYPSAFVRPRDELASFGLDGEVWYVHRRDEPLRTEAAEAATAPLDPSAGRVTAASRTATGPGSAPVYSAGRVAGMIGVPVSLLVSWDEQDGLVTPARTSAGIALYSRNQVEQLLVAKRSFASGKTLDEVRELMGSPAASRQPAGAGRRLLVLLAERDPDAAEFSEYFLRTEGYAVEVALTALEAEERATELQPDLVIVELLISGGAGAELCARLKTRPDAKVLAISTLDFEDAALQAGADAFLAKPFDPLAFVSTVKDLMGESAMLREPVNASPATDGLGGTG